MAELRVGFTIQERHFARGVGALQDLSEDLERMGVDFAAVLDHLSFWDGSGFDAMINATALAAAHPRLPILTSVMVLPIRHPVTVARQVSSLSVFAPGRLVLGVGVGGEDRHEISAAGIDPRTRGRRMDEALTIVRQLLSGEAVTFDGDFFTISDVTIKPAPVERVRILVGGRSDIALMRTARAGEGWLGFACSPARFAQGLKLVAAEAERVGRGNVEFEHGLVVWCGFGEPDDARARLRKEMESLYKVPFERFARYCPCGKPDDVAAQLVEYVSGGCTRFSIIPVGQDLQHELDSVATVRAALTTQFAR
ncbi:MAG TPA: LLM class flavin-dependent oxidoreductase [Acidimicrobiia bacterium]|jgi:alkanesulfonate monooxygenase SsuD/methylene tetrahydromethanopterin reductase-like flavin-dependent oxidoreductase (luciferase family)